MPSPHATELVDEETLVAERPPPSFVPPQRRRGQWQVGLVFVAVLVVVAGAFAVRKSRSGESSAAARVPTVRGVAAADGPLVGGLSVAPGSRLVGGTFVGIVNEKDRAARAEEQIALLVVDGDPFAVLRDYARQMQVAGYEPSGGCRAARVVLRDRANDSRLDGRPLGADEGLDCELVGDRPARADRDGTADGWVTVRMRLIRGRVGGLGPPQAHLSVERGWLNGETYTSPAPVFPDSREDVQRLARPTSVPAVFDGSVLDGPRGRLATPDVKVPVLPRGVTLAAPVMAADARTVRAAAVTDRAFDEVLAGLRAEASRFAFVHERVGIRDGVRYGVVAGEEPGGNHWSFYLRADGERTYVLVCMDYD